MKTHEIICIGCPMGCPMTVTENDDGTVTVAGNTCPRGAAYGEKEIKAPTRCVTSSVIVSGGEIARVSVKTERDVPKGRIFDVMEKIRSTTLDAPVTIGDVVIRDVCGTGVNVIATKTVDKKHNGVNL